MWVKKPPADYIPQALSHLQGSSVINLYPWLSGCNPKLLCLCPVWTASPYKLKIQRLFLQNNLLCKKGNWNTSRNYPNMGLDQICLKSQNLLNSRTKTWPYSKSIFFSLFSWPNAIETQMIVCNIIQKCIWFSYWKLLYIITPGMFSAILDHVVFICNFILWKTINQNEQILLLLIFFYLDIQFLNMLSKSLCYGYIGKHLIKYILMLIVISCKNLR